MSLKKAEINKDDINQLIDNARFLIKQDKQQALEFLNKALALSAKSKFTDGMAHSLKALGNVYFQQGDYKNSLNSYQEAIANYEKLHNESEIRNCYDDISDIYFKVGDSEQSLSTQLKVLASYKQAKDKGGMANAYNKIGEIYKHHTEYRKAIDHHFLALKLFEKLGDKRQLANTNFYIGNCYNWVNEFDIAQNYLVKALELAEESGDPHLKIKPLGSIAILYTKLQQYDKSLAYFQKAIENVTITGNDYLKADIFKSLGKLYIELNEPQKAIEALQEALQISERLQVKFPTNFIHLFLSETYEKTGNYKEALEHFKKYMYICKEINNEQVSLKTLGVQLKFDLDEIKKEKEIAEKSIQLKDRFLSNISHEIRTPLNGILGMVNLMSDTRPSPEQLEYINTIRLSANNLLITINDLFDYSKINSGKIAFNKEEFKIKELLTSVLQLTKVKADEKKLQLSLSYDENTPDFLIGDPARLNQILMNVLNNAVKFTENGSIGLEMQTLEERGNHVKLLFKISDTGIGISEERLPKIFESFTQTQFDDANSTSGTGLGLTIVKHLVEMQGGSISVNSTVGSGTIFKIELEFRVPEKPVKKTAVPRRSEYQPQDLSLISILLVEDNRVNQFLAKQLLSKMGFYVEIASNGKEALEQLKKRNYDAILMDVQMPGMNGYELSEHIRTQLSPPQNRIPIIALTAYASAQEKEKAMSLGMNDYITKPYSPQELLTVILKHVKMDGTPATDSKPENIIETLLSLLNRNKNDVANLIEMFLEQVPAINKELEKHIHEKNWGAAFQDAHKVKSSIKILKIPQLTEAITELEDLTRSHMKTETLAQLFQDYNKTCNEYLKVLKKELAKLKAG